MYDYFIFAALGKMDKAYFQKGFLFMLDVHEILLHIAFTMSNHGQIITVDAVRQPLTWLLCENLDLEKEMTQLVKDRFLLVNNEGEFTFTPLGEKEACRINKARTRDDFKLLIDRAANSTAYLNYCADVYGYRMPLFNAMDKEQLDYLFNNDSISPCDTVLDLGCGSGCILEQLVKKHFCRGIGIDQVNTATVIRCSPLISYIKGDLDALADYQLSPTLTLAVDSLYFSNDLEGLIGQFKAIPHNRLFLYWSQYIFDVSKKNGKLLDGDHTRLAGLLQKQELPYRVVDYSANEYALYERALRVLPQYKEAMAGEGNSDLYEKYLRESISGKEMYDHGLASRHLYIVEA